MKVILGSFPSISLHGGGVDVQVRSLVRELIKNGVEAELFDPWKKYRTDEYALFHLFAAHNGTYHLGRAVKSLNMKLVLTPVFFSRRSFLRLKFSVRVGQVMRKAGGIWTEHQFCLELCSLADLILVNTEEEKKLICKGLGISASKIAKLPNGVDTTFYYATEEQFIKHYDIKNFVLYVGHIGLGRKNLIPLLKILNKRRIPSVLIGPVLNTSYGHRCLDLISASPNIKLIPGLPSSSELLRSAYAACDTFILPSFYETPGLAALEAGLAGAKICITQYGGTKEYFGDYAHYLNPYSERSIEEALEKAIQQPKTSNLREHIYQNFTWDKCAQVLMQFYTQLSGE
ncbi:MAG: glycosyltransferase family 4 protein [candidate division WOR-3 bacterium]|jgi:glycosyltransferase involved in cell wall biosynthesis